MCNTNHLNCEQVLRMMAVRRKQLSVSGRSEIPPPTPPTPHPGYAPNAAFHAIKRHALEFVNPKEMQVIHIIPICLKCQLNDNIYVYSSTRCCAMFGVN